MFGLVPFYDEAAINHISICITSANEYVLTQSQPT